MKMAENGDGSISTSLTIYFKIGSWYFWLLQFIDYIYEKKDKIKRRKLHKNFYPKNIKRLNNTEVLIKNNIIQLTKRIE